MASQPKNYQKAGEQAFQKIEKIVCKRFANARVLTNAELLSMTYGSLVTQLLKDYEDVDEVNKQLDRMGYKMGLRLIDEYMSKTTLDSCKDIKDAAESIAKVGFKMFLGVTATVSAWQEVSPEKQTPNIEQQLPPPVANNNGQQGNKQLQFSLTFDENPLTDFVELPDHYKIKGIWYCNILPGVIRGCLEMVQMKVECQYVKCPLRGDDVNEIRVRLIEYLKEVVPDDD